MNDSIIIALLVAASGWGASLITGWFTTRATAASKELERIKRELANAYRDIAALSRLEEKYIRLLETKEKSAPMNGGGKPTSTFAVKDTGHHPRTQICSSPKENWMKSSDKLGTPPLRGFPFNSQKSCLGQAWFAIKHSAIGHS